MFSPRSSHRSSRRPVSSIRAQSTACALLLALAWPLAPSAQTPSSPGTPGQQPSEAQGSKPAQRSSSQGAQARNLGASDVVGMEVLSSQGEKLGRVKDLVIDSARASVSYVVLAHGGVLGVGSDLFPYPLNSFQLDDKGRMILNVPRERLEKSPGYGANDWSKVSGDTSFWSDLDRRFAIGQGERSQAPSGSPAGGQEGRRFVRATDVIGEELLNPSGQSLGKVRDLVVDVRTGAVRHALIDVPNSSRMLQTPMDRVELRAEGKDVVVRHRDEQLAPSQNGQAPPRGPQGQPRPPQGQPRPQSHVVPATSVVMTQAGAPDARPLEGKATTVKLQPNELRARRLMGAEVKNPSGERLGHVKDLVIDMRNGDIAYVVLARGGLLGVGQDMFPYPMQSFKIEPGRALTLNVSRQSLENSRGFSDEDWPRVRGDRGFWSQLDDRYGVGASDSKRRGHQGSGDSGYFVRATELVGEEVVGGDSRPVGRIDDIVVDVTKGHVNYAAVDLVRGGPKVAVDLPQLDALATGVDVVIRQKGDRLDLTRIIDDDAQWREQAKTR